MERSRPRCKRRLFTSAGTTDTRPNYSSPQDLDREDFQIQSMIAFEIAWQVSSLGRYGNCPGAGSVDTRGGPREERVVQLRTMGTKSRKRRGQSTVQFVATPKVETSLPFASGRRKSGAGSFVFKAPSGTPASRRHDESSRSVWLSSVRKLLKVPAKASIGVLTGRPFETSSSILVLPQRCPSRHLSAYVSCTVTVRSGKRKFNFGMVVVDE